ncbi:hypothetical protein T484DRAFT_1782187 [Baffinella frigidus]|nr:hypothetical protein T484DRAFT_1782187 [Cryptophyta sp. CCMP2293]
MPCLTSGVAQQNGGRPAADAVCMHTPGRKMQVWSNNEAIQEYRDLLAGKRQDDTNDGPSVIIGDGRLGTMLRNAGGNSGDVIVKRGDAIPEELADGVTDFPLYVCVPEHEVEAVIKACPQSKLDDLVFCQKGNIELLLKKYALCGNDNTQMLPYFSIFSKESRPMSELEDMGKDSFGSPKSWEDMGKNSFGSPNGLAGQELEDMGKDSFGSPKYAGETVIVGKWKGALAQRLDRIQLPSQPRGYLDYHPSQLDRIQLPSQPRGYLDYRRSMIEHTVFESVYNLVGLLHKGIPLGEVGLYHQKECEDMIHEMHRALRGSMAVTLLSGVEGRCKALSQNTNVEMRKPKCKALSQNPNVDVWKPKLGEFMWYNGFFYKISLDCKEFEVYGKKGAKGSISRASPGSEAA